MLKRLILTLLLLTTSGILHAQLGSTPGESVSHYGKPERESLKQRGLLYFRKEPLCIIAHFDHGRCDVLSIFSSTENLGLPDELDGEKLPTLLKENGGGKEWKSVAHFSINRLWDSTDNSSFAIYDTMRHKLVIMTHDAYSREKSAAQDARKKIQVQNPEAAIKP